MVQSKGIHALSQVKFIGEDRARAIVESLGIESIDELVEAAQRGALLEVPGIGKATQARILDSALLCQAAIETPQEADPAPTPEVDAPVTPPQSARAFLESVLICPNCGHDSLESRYSSLVCSACRREYSEHKGAVDMAPPYISPQNPTQRVMESAFYAKYYESFMRPKLTSVVSTRSLDHEYELSTKYLELESGSRVLDVACGTANFSRHFAKHAASQGLEDVHVVGVDLSIAMLERAHAYVQREGLGQSVCLMRGDATKLPLHRSSFDRLHCAAALHFMSDPDEALSQFARVLSPDGVCVLTTFVRGRGRVRRLLKSLMQRPTGFGWFEPDDLTRRLNQAGFDVMSTSVDGDASTVKARRI